MNTLQIINTKMKIMKNPFFLILISFLISCSQNKENKSFIIDGKIEGISTGKALIEYSDFKDTAEIKNGQFNFKGTVQKPEICKIIIEGFEHQTEFYLENSKISFLGYVDSLDKVKISGSKTEYENYTYNQILNKYERKFQDIENEYEGANDSRKEELKKLYEKADLEMVKAQKQFIKDNPTSYLCIGILIELDWSFKTAKEYQEYISILDTSLNQYKRLISLKEHVGRMEKVEPGNIAPDFEISDINGNKIKLSDHYSKSKYTLLDFWASTCGPCRIENKHILKAYKKYHDKGFDVFGVSQDSKKELWLNAIKKDSLVWTNTCHLQKESTNELIKMYALNQVSANFLLDNTGKIIDKDLHGEDLEIKLAELFN